MGGDHYSHIELHQAADAIHISNGGALPITVKVRCEPVAPSAGNIEIVGRINDAERLISMVQQAVNSIDAQLSDLRSRVISLETRTPVVPNGTRRVREQGE
jgi:hypothetical protein